MSALENPSNAGSVLPNSYNALSIEDEVRGKWSAENLREKIRQKFYDRNAKQFGYVDGPPTLNGEPHMGHLRGRIMKEPLVSV